VTGAASPLFVAATSEVPPQAQLIAHDGAFELTPGATAVIVEIAPIDPPAEPGDPGTRIAGNVYRFTVTDQAGSPLSIARCEGCIALSMRAPEGTESGRLLRFAGGEWTDVDAIHVAMTGMYSWTATALGDFAVVASTGNGGIDPLLIAIGGSVVALALAVAAGLALRRPPRGGGGPARVARSGSAGGSPTRMRTPGKPSRRTTPPKPPTKRSEP
jgi:hypothetical protein